MEQTQVFKLNQKNKYVKKLSKGFVILGVYPMITTGIMLVLFILFYLIGTKDSSKNNFIIQWVGNNVLIVIQIFIGIVILQGILGIFRIVKYIKIQNSLIIKEGKDIMMLYKINVINQLSASATVVGGLAMDNDFVAGLGMYLAGISTAKVKEEETIKPIIKEIVDDPRSIYKFYTDCKLVTETKKYYLFNGTNIDYAGKTKNENFKIYKIYSNIEQIVEGGKLK